MKRPDRHDSDTNPQRVLGTILAVVGEQAGVEAVRALIEQHRSAQAAFAAALGRRAG